MQTRSPGRRKLKCLRDHELVGGYEFHSHSEAERMPLTCRHDDASTPVPECGVNCNSW